MSTLETAVAPPRPRSPRTFWWLLAVQAFGVVSLLPWLFVVGYGPTHFDLLYGDADAGMWAAALLLWAYPLVLIACSIGAWVAYRKGRNTLAVALSAVPLFFSAYHVARVYHYISQPTDCCALLGPVPIMQPPGTTPGSS